VSAATSGSRPATARRSRRLPVPAPVGPAFPPGRSWCRSSVSAGPQCLGVDAGDGGHVRQREPLQCLDVDDQVECLQAERPTEVVNLGGERAGRVRLAQLSRQGPNARSLVRAIAVQQMRRLAPAIRAYSCSSHRGTTD